MGYKPSYKIPVGLLLIVLAIALVFIHGYASVLISDGFDRNRFGMSYVFMIIYVAGALALSRITQPVPPFRADKAVRYVFYFLLLTVGANLIGVSPFLDKEKAILIYSEPSHFALSFMPIFLYMSVYSRSKIKLLILGYAIALALENTTVLVGIILVSLIVLPLRRITVVAAGIVLLVMTIGIANFEYYSQRLSVDPETQNLSMVVYLGSWERAYLNLTETNGLGVGFQQFGIIGSQGEFADRLATLYAEGLNQLGGACVAPKFISEFGIFALITLVIYVVNWLKIVRKIRKIVRIGADLDECKKVFFYSCFVMYSIDLFIRGVGYFSSSGFLFIASIGWMFLAEKSTMAFYGFRKNIA